jgi:KipI family sensor histidine kinase inhibitor
MMSISHQFIHPKLVEISWPEQINHVTLHEIIFLKDQLNQQYKTDIKAIHIGFRSIGILFQKIIDPLTFSSVLTEISNQFVHHSIKHFKTWQIPVCYDLRFAKDLKNLADYHRLTVDEIIITHSQSTYTLHFYGFLPGFMYLGGLNEKIHTPRKQHPDLKVNAGDVAIGGSQTGIYPQESPGGWHVIGNSPLHFFDIKRDQIVFPQPGDVIKFKSIDLEEYDQIKTLLAQNNYQWKYE